MHKSRISLLFSIALTAVLAAPAAFAQDANVQDAKAQQAPPQEASQAPAQSAQDAEPAKKGWSELDADGNGSLNVGEAAALQSLAKAFAQADADGNGELTQEEYRAWLSSNGNKDVPKQ